MSQPAPSMRVMTLNLWHSPIQMNRRLQRAAAEIAGRRPHAVLVQEAAQEAGGRNIAAELAQATGLHLAGIGDAVAAGALGEASTCAVLTRQRPIAAHVLNLPGHSDNPQRSRQQAVVVETTTPSGRPCVLATTHLAWGGRMEWARLAQAVAVDQLIHALPAATHQDAVTVFAGDFNTGPDSDTLRFLLGQGVTTIGTDNARNGGDPGDPGGRGGPVQPGGVRSDSIPRSTFWVDAWDVAGCGDGTTSSPDNQWARYTAAQVGITDPRMLPNRRIDFLLVRGWVFGRPGYPIAARRAFTQPIGVDGTPVVASDHFGVEADLWDPPLATSTRPTAAWTAGSTLA